MGSKVIIVGLTVAGLLYMISKPNVLNSDVNDIYYPPPPDLSDIEGTLDDYYHDIPVSEETENLGLHGGEAYLGLLAVLTYCNNPTYVEMREQWMRVYGGAGDGYYLLPSSWTNMTEWYISNGGKDLIITRDTVYYAGQNRIFRYFTAPDNTSLELFMLACSTCGLTPLYRVYNGQTYILSCIGELEDFDNKFGTS
jgi:hypothetical protein